MSNTTIKSVRTMIAAATIAAASVSHAQNTISYQGTLNDAGAPANGTYDMRFSVWNDPTSGPPDFQFGVTQTLLGVTVEDGLFNVSLNLGDEAYQSFDPRYLQIEVRASGGGGYTELAPRSQLDFTPRSIFASQAQTASSLELPLLQSGAPFSEFGGVLSITNATPSGYAISGDGPTWGIIGYGGDYSSFPPVTTPAGVFGIGETVGTGGSSGSGSGVFGITSTGYAGQFRVAGNNTGLPLWANTNGSNNAALIEINNPASNSAALIARTDSTLSSTFAIHGLIESASPGGNSTGVRGENRGAGGLGIGVWGSQAGSGWGVYGTSSDGGRGVYGLAVGSGGYGVYASGVSGADAGFFLGDVIITGSISKGSGTFKIDHPLDPANMYLSHSFVESPEMKNIYDGVAILNEEGAATVTMPTYFDALNTEFRYQLTCIGGYAPVYIAEEISERQFTIAGGSPGLKVSWQITGVRQDPFAVANPVRVEEEKSSEDKGRYLHPELYGQPKERSIGYTAQPMPDRN